ncbi:hypothetical protein D3C76_1394470 [compost metagenome]
MTVVHFEAMPTLPSLVISLASWPVTPAAAYSFAARISDLATSGSDGNLQYHSVPLSSLNLPPGLEPPWGPIWVQLSMDSIGSGAAGGGVGSAATCAAATLGLLAFFGLPAAAFSAVT